jgi:hypothetical protein
MWLIRGELQDFLGLSGLTGFWGSESRAIEAADGRMHAMIDRAWFYRSNIRQ